jgi:homoserine kinase
MQTISPCIFGGITLIKSSNPIDIIPLNSPDLFVTAVHPQIEVKTSDARQIPEEKYSSKDAIEQWGNIAGLVAGIQNNDFGLIGKSLKDVIVEPVEAF